MRISNIFVKRKNITAKCKCGKVAKFRTEIQVNKFRGDDEFVWSCDEHKNDCEFLMSSEVIND